MARIQTPESAAASIAVGVIAVFAAYCYTLGRKERLEPPSAPAVGEDVDGAGESAASLAEPASATDDAAALRP